MRRGAAGLALGTVAVACGAAFLADVGALPGMGTRNVLAYVLGLGLGVGAHFLSLRRHAAAILFAVATLVIGAVLVFGIELDGVRRWLPMGPFNLQPALILAPLLLAIVASSEGRHWRVAILAPILLVALQPDAATMVALAGGTAAFIAATSARARRGWSARRIAIAAAAVTVAVLGLVVAGIRTPPPVAFVEGTVDIAMASGMAARALHLAATGLMLAALLARDTPAAIGLATYFALAALAAVFWAFPMPVVGAGPSHLIGFGIALGWLVVSGRRAHQRPADA